MMKDVKEHMVDKKNIHLMAMKLNKERINKQGSKISFKDILTIDDV